MKTPSIKNSAKVRRARKQFPSRNLVLAATLAASACLLGMAADSEASLLVVPGAQAATEGNNSNIFPFSISSTGLTSMRYQQVYDSSAFSAFTGPSLITQIAFRPDGTFGAIFSTTLPDLQIDLSTTAFGPDALSATFASNVGADDKVVFPRGSLALSSNFTGPAGGPKAFDIVINLPTPFLYDPALGNLLLDVRNFGAGTTLPFDAENTLGDSVSRAFASNGVNSPIAGGTPTSGLITRFTLEPVVPEPSALALLISAGGALAGLRRFRRRKASCGCADGPD